MWRDRPDWPRSERGRLPVHGTCRQAGPEQATHLPNDFLSAASPDLKTPLTALVGQAQLMEVRARRDPTAPPDLKGIQRMMRASIALPIAEILRMVDYSTQDSMDAGGRHTGRSG